MNVLAGPAIVAVLGAATLNASAAEIAGPGHPVTDWNEQVLAIARAEDGFLTLKGVRTAAMMHLAMHDALSNISGRYQTYAYAAPAPEARPLAAAVQAAFVIAADQYPDSRARFEQLRDRWLADVPEGAGRDAGIDLGSATARAVMARRHDDGWDTEAEYRWHPMGPGVYAEFSDHSATPQGFVFGAGWAKARTFALTGPDQFRSPPPPAIDSVEYARAFEEVKSVGRFQTLARTPDQTHLALWWKDFAENSHNRLARSLVQKERPGLDESARLFALLNVALFDAYVNVFDNKFFHNHWRPYTAIRWAASDGNAATEPEPTWTNTHRHTYAFPSYPSAHGAVCAAAMTVMADTFGDDYAFTMFTPRVDIAGPFSGQIEMKPPSRSFARFSEAAMECAMSRVYLGIHFRYDSTEGNALGSKIGDYVVGTILAPAD